MVRPSQRKEMAVTAVRERRVCVRLACEAFRISESCYRYERKLDSDNEAIATWLIKLTDNNRNWGFGLCYLYLRNLKGFKWNHKRIYRVYKALELNLRIKPRKRLIREKPEALTVPHEINQVWSMDFMHDQLEDGRTFRLLNVIDDYESPRDLRRLQDLREWSHEAIKQVFTRDSGACSADGARASERLFIAVGGDFVDCAKDRMRTGNIA